MKRKPLFWVGIGSLALAGVLVFAGVVLRSNAKFAEDYVGNQLRVEGITFKPAAELNDYERSYTEARTGCVIAYAGQTILTGKQAECYANEYILAHMQNTGEGAIPNVEGRTYVQLGGVQSELREKVAEAEASGDPALTDLQEQLAGITAARDTVFKGTMLRSALLTSYGFSVFGEKAAQAATWAFVGSAILGFLGLVGIGFAFAPRKRSKRELYPHDIVPAQERESARS